MEYVLPNIPDMICTAVIVGIGVYFTNKVMPVLERILDIQERRLERAYRSEGEDREDG